MSADIPQDGPCECTDITPRESHDGPPSPFTCLEHTTFGNCDLPFMTNTVSEIPEGFCQVCIASTLSLSERCPCYSLLKFSLCVQIACGRCDCCLTVAQTLAAENATEFLWAMETASGEGFNTSDLLYQPGWQATVFAPTNEALLPLFEKWSALPCYCAPSYFGPAENAKKQCAIYARCAEPAAGAPCMRPFALTSVLLGFSFAHRIQVHCRCHKRERTPARRKLERVGRAAHSAHAPRAPGGLHCTVPHHRRLAASDAGLSVRLLPLALYSPFPHHRRFSAPYEGLAVPSIPLRTAPFLTTGVLLPPMLAFQCAPSPLVVHTAPFLTTGVLLPPMLPLQCASSPSAQQISSPLASCCPRGWPIFAGLQESRSSSLGKASSGAFRTTAAAVSCSRQTSLPAWCASASFVLRLFLSASSFNRLFPSTSLASSLKPLLWV